MSDHFSGIVLSLAFFLSLCCSLVPGAPVKRNATGLQGADALFMSPDHQSRCGPLLLNNPADTCDFHSRCIEPFYMCDTTGFALDYAERRCQAISKASASFNGSEQLLSWLQDHERCLRRKLLLLVKKFAASGDPGPSACLRFEHEGFIALSECYDESAPAFCSALSNQSYPEVVQETLHLLDIVTLNSSFYNHTVTRGLVALLDQCPLNTAANVSLWLQEQYPHREVICAYHSLDKEGGTYDPSQYTRNVSRLLNIPEDQLIYSTTELPSERKPCFGNGPDYLTHVNRVHVILWSVPAATAVNPANLDRNQYFGQLFLSTWWGNEMYRKVGQCGDALRQAGETCDSGVYSGAGKGFGCSADCVTLEGYECHGEQLSRVECVSQECGNGKTTSDEACDDGNLDGGDGCSSNCTIEPGFDCIALPYLWQRSLCSPLPDDSLSPSPSSSLSLPSSSTVTSPSPSSSYEASLPLLLPPPQSVAPSESLTPLSRPQSSHVPLSPSATSSLPAAAPSTTPTRTTPTTPTTPRSNPLLPTLGLSTSMMALAVVGGVVGGFVVVSCVVLCLAVICSYSSCKTVETGSAHKHNSSYNSHTKTAVIEYTSPDTTLKSNRLSTESPSNRTTLTLSTSTSSSSDNLAQPQIQQTKE